MKNSREKRNRKEKGITLIALVVTIVILIILASIGINAVFGEEGLIPATQYSKEEYRAGSVRDEVIEWRNGKSLSKERGEEVKLRETLLTELVAKNLLTTDEKTTVEEKNEVEIASQTIYIEPDDPESLNPDLTIEKKIISTPPDGRAYYMLGDVVEYEIKVKNEGSTTVPDIVVTDELTRTKRNEANEEVTKTIKKQEFRELKDENGNELKDKNGNVVTNALEPQQEGYIRYTYTIVQEDLGSELTNKAIVKTKRKIPDPIKTPVDEETGTITLTKQVKAIELSSDEYTKLVTTKEYEFNITLKKNGENIKTPVYYKKDSSSTKMTITNGEGTFTLKHGESINIYGIPDGTTYRIEEKEGNRYNEDYTYVTRTGYQDSQGIGSNEEWCEGTINLKEKEIVTLTCCNTVERQKGRLNIVKNITGYNQTLGQTSFIFKIEAKEKNGEIVYSDYASITFTKPGTETITISDIPAGTTVTVTEVYSGASYEVVGDSVKTCTIVSDQAINAGEATQASVSFTNKYNGGNRGGYAVTNHFDRDGDGWTAQNPTK